MYIFFGLVCDKTSLIENFNNEYILRNPKPELVEKKEPPIITKINSKKFRLFGIEVIEKPILDILLVKDKKIWLKLLSKLKNRKKKDKITKK